VGKLFHIYFNRTLCWRQMMEDLRDFAFAAAIGIPLLVLSLLGTLRWAWPMWAIAIPFCVGMYLLGMHGLIFLQSAAIYYSYHVRKGRRRRG
jgi:hypothetical protein